MTRILNLTKHPATDDQVAAGVVEPDNKSYVQSLLTFDDVPSYLQMASRALNLVQIAKELGYEEVMIGGALFFMAPLEHALVEAGIKPLYSFTLDERHASFVPGATWANSPWNNPARDHHCFLLDCSEPSHVHHPEPPSNANLG